MINKVIKEIEETGVIVVANLPLIFDVFDSINHNFLLDSDTVYVVCSSFSMFEIEKMLVDSQKSDFEGSSSYGVFNTPENILENKVNVFGENLRPKVSFYRNGNQFLCFKSENIETNKMSMVFHTDDNRVLVNLNP